MIAGRLRRFGLALALSCALSACVGMPDEGPVVRTDAEADVEEGRAMSIDAAPPQAGAGPADVVSGFLDAMEASPIRVDVARQFLSDESQESWDPEQSTIVHSGLSSPEVAVTETEVTVQMDAAEALDRRGSWRGRLSSLRQKLRYDMVVEDGEWRIKDPLDALVVSAGWFEARYSQVSLYYFDRAARVLVPEPVFVPGGEQSATSLVRGLLVGPPDELGGSARTFIPESLEVELSVPVSAAGVADLSLVGDSRPIDPADADLMVAQFAWTLAQDPEVSSFTINLDGTDVRLPGGETEFPVTDTGRFDPNGSESREEFFALRDGVLVAGVGQDLAAVSGPWGESPQGVETIAVDLTGQTVVGVVERGTSLLRTQVRGGDEEPVAIDQVVSNATDLLEPAWDGAGHAWLVDRTAGGARVSYLQGNRIIPVRVPGISRQRVIDFLVSRDGTRFLAVVRGLDGLDTVRAGRLRTLESGRRVVSTTTRELVFEGSDSLRITDIAWASPTEVQVLSPVVADELYEVRTVAVDGAPPGLSTTIDQVNGRVQRLVGSPVADETNYVRTQDALIPVEGNGVLSLGESITELSYVG